MDYARLIEAEVNLPGAGVHIVSSTHWPTKLDFTFCSEEHLLAMYLSGAPAEGRYSEADNDQEFVPVGSVFFRPAKRHLQVRGQSTAGVVARAIHCTVDDSRLQRLNVSGIDWSGDALQSSLNIRSSQLRAYFLRMKAEVSQPSFATPIIIDAMLTMMVSDLLSYLSPENEKQEAKLGTNDAMIRKVRERVCDLHAVTPTVGELAALCGVSERHLLRLFRERLGASLIEFIREARLEKAMELLTSSKLRLKEIAFLLGFQSHASFTTAFGREVGISPAEYRRAHRGTYLPAKSTVFC